MMTSSILLDSEWFRAFCINAILIAIVQRLPLLTRSGWCHAGALGTILLGCLGWSGWLFVVVYLLFGSLVTRLGFARKQEAGLAEGRGGRRGPENLWGSAATGTFLAILIGAGFGPKNLLLIGFTASFAAKLADTFGSEIGKRWGGKTVLITSLRPVPVGTDGAISLEGTLASALGSLVMTVATVVFFLKEVEAIALLVFLSGFLATLFESFLGAVVQQRFAWLSNEMINGLQTIFAAVFAMTIASLVL